MSSSSQLDSPKGSLETSGNDGLAYLRRERYGSAEHDDFAPVLPEESAFRHSGNAKGRRRVYEALLRTGQSCRRVANFADCGNTLWLMRDGSEPILVCGKCHDRLCDACQREAKAAVVEGVLLRCHDATQSLRFVTLTLKHVDAPLRFQLDRLTSCFKLLRSHPDVAATMTGGVWFIEVKLDKALRLWHPHLHCIIEGTWLDKRDLAKAWHQVTGDSFIVDIDTITDAAKRARYVAKYSTKPLHPSVSRVPAKLDEFVVAIKGKRLYQCFGSWSRAVKRDKSPKRVLTRVAHLSVLHAQALEGHAESMVWMRICHGRWPRLQRLFPLPAGPPPSTVAPSSDGPPLPAT